MNAEPFDSNLLSLVPCSSLRQHISWPWSAPRRLPVFTLGFGRASSARGVDVHLGEWYGPRVSYQRGESRLHRAVHRLTERPKLYRRILVGEESA